MNKFEVIYTVIESEAMVVLNHPMNKRRKKEQLLH